MEECCALPSIRETQHQERPVKTAPALEATAKGASTRVPARSGKSKNQGVPWNGLASVREGATQKDWLKSP